MLALHIQACEKGRGSEKENESGEEKIAVDNGFGGVYSQQKADWMVDVLQQYFYDNAILQQDEVEDYIADLMDNEFDTVVDDGSLSQVAQTISQIFTQCQQGKFADVKEKISMLNQKSAERAKVTPQPNVADEECEDDEKESMECETAVLTNASSTATKKKEPTSQSQEENDGWTTVVRKK
uniref:Pre-rRNA-processing protein TSR2 homolog n=1 Tax=Esox lucius TaxID=8010 RepID=A0AAY5LAM3_ESOLU